MYIGTEIANGADLLTPSLYLISQVKRNNCVGLINNLKVVTSRKVCFVGKLILINKIQNSRIEMRATTT